MLSWGTDEGRFHLLPAFRICLHGRRGDEDLVVIRTWTHHQLATNPLRSLQTIRTRTIVNIRIRVKVR